MSFLLQSPPLFSLTFPPISSSPRTLTLIFPLRSQPISRRRRRRHRPIVALHVGDRDLIQNLTAASASNLPGGDQSSPDQLPIVRCYETDLTSLALVGSVGFEQALTAAAADGGDAAEEHLANGRETMVVETLFPGSAGRRSTVSTRLFLPAKKVKEKAKKLRSSLGADFLYSSVTSSENMLAMTFRQVILQTLWSYRLSFFCPGTERDMEHLASPREVLADFTVSSSDKRFLSKLAEVVCSFALEGTKKTYLQNEARLPNIMFDWFRNPESTFLADSPICIYRLSRGEIMKNAKNQMEKFNFVKRKFVYKGKKLKHNLLDLPNFSLLDKFGGPELSEWANEFAPAYRLQIDANTFKDIKLEGWQELSNNRWEVLLTHFQMVELVDILDMYYEDQHTLPDKELSGGLAMQSLVISKKKHSIWKMLFTSLVIGCTLIAASILAQIYWPDLLKERKVAIQDGIPSFSETHVLHHKSLEDAEVEALCVSIIQKIKDELGWPENVMFDKNFGAWTGALPSCFRIRDTTLYSVSTEEVLATSSSTDDSLSSAELTSSVTATSGPDSSAMPTPAEDIASYQVVMSGDGKVIGFQPTSRVAVNQWASNPLAKLLYGGRKLSPGLLEPTLRIPHPNKVVLIELLMSINPKSRFALSRPIQ